MIQCSKELLKVSSLSKGHCLSLETYDYVWISWITVLFPINTYSLLLHFLLQLFNYYFLLSQFSLISWSFLFNNILKIKVVKQNSLKNIWENNLLLFLNLSFEWTSSQKMIFLKIFLELVSCTRILKRQTYQLNYISVLNTSHLLKRQDPCWNSSLQEMNSKKCYFPKYLSNN